MYRYISEFDLDITDLIGESDKEEEPTAEERHDNKEDEDEDEDKDEDEDEDKDEAEGEDESEDKIYKRALGKRRKSVDSYGEEDKTEP
ncbi:uncharacterized protein N7496_004491 [Penicillium cataractarum]|uniref:Histone chaperone domain-containing protein n=1 Tax=Penicillium cataractarum TaxID=2100454 RepID=A0A9W9ST95_9EURO|nr:uncharacterized protein N7496_004491 [Penicillium cataractarum]KAJ5382063.1 hypothetical protein N7496_004491 [Penicillium cataractarum]